MRSDAITAYEDLVGKPAPSKPVNEYARVESNTMDGSVLLWELVTEFECEDSYELNHRPERPGTTKHQSDHSHAGKVSRSKSK